MVRVAALKRAHRGGGMGADGPAAEEQLNAIAIRVRALLERQARCFSEVCRPALAEHGVRILRWDELSATQQETLRRYFTDQIFPLVTPQALTRAPGHPFPLMPNLRLSLAALVRDSRAGPVHFAYLKVPDTLPRFVNWADGGGLVAVEDIIRANLGMVYPGRVVEEAYAFRVTRGADLELDEHHAASLLQVIEEETKRHPSAPRCEWRWRRICPGPYGSCCCASSSTRTRRRRARSARTTCTRRATSWTWEACASWLGCRSRGSTMRRTRVARPSTPAGRSSRYWPTGTSSYITRTMRSRRRCSAWSPRRRTTRRSWRSSKRCIARAGAPTSWTRWCARPRTAKKCSCSSSSRPGSTKSGTSSGPGSSRKRASGWSTVWWSSRSTPRRPSSCAAKPAAFGATCISAPATTTPRRRPCIPTWACCRRTRPSART